MCIIGLKLKRTLLICHLKPIRLNKKRYQTLDAIRFIAFFKVFMLHLPEGQNAHVYNFLKLGGGTSVSIFFVLSGFLISDILIRQKLNYGKINPVNFFWRRALRIWPLYFLGVVIAYLGIALTSHWGISESAGYAPQPFYSFLFLENYKSIFEGNYPRGVPLQVFWSLCIEEHFYLLWIFIFIFTPLKHLVKTFGGLWVLAIISRAVSIQFLPQYHINGAEIITSLDYFVAGGLVAAYMNGLFAPRISKINYKSKLTVYILTAIFLTFQQLWFDFFGVFAISISAIIYGLCILSSVMEGDNKLVISNTALMSRLGVISYGLYVFHTPVIMSLRKLFDKLGYDYQTNFGLIVFFVLALSISILIASLSYRFYEGRFLTLRDKYLS